MKKQMVLLAFLLPLFGLAQNTSGTIHYQQEIKIKIELPEGHEDLKDMIPASQTVDKVLFFTEKESLYRDLSEEDMDDTVIEQEQASEDGETRMKMIIARPENKLYKNVAKNEKADSRDFMGRKFLINGALDAYAWKMTNEQKEILDYTCRKATCEKEGKTIEAWFTTQIPIANGPDNFGQLPGMILQIITDEGDRTTTATKVELGAVPADAIFIPEKGKKVAQEEYDEIVKKKMEEMGAESGGGATFKIKIDNN